MKNFANIILLFLAMCFSHNAMAQSSASGPDNTPDTTSSFSLRNNLVWSAAAEPNIAMDYMVGKHVSVGLAFGLKAWPRWAPWDWSTGGDNKHWRNFAIVPQVRYWPKYVYQGWFAGTDFVYTHYNVGAVKFPFGIYKDVETSRVQGSFWGGGLFGGYSWQLAPQWRLEAEAGLAAGLAAHDRFDCPHCGTKIDTEHKPAVVPKLGLNIVWQPRKSRILFCVVLARDLIKEA